MSIRTWEAFAHPDDLKQSSKRLECHFAGELPHYDAECQMKHKDGHRVWVHDRGHVITRTDDGKPLMMFASHTEITERKRAEQALRLQHELVVALGQTADRKEQLQLCLSQAVRVSEMDSGGIYLLDAKTQTLQLASYQGISDEFARESASFGPQITNFRLVVSGQPICDMANRAATIEDDRHHGWDHWPDEARRTPLRTSAGVEAVRLTLPLPALDHCGVRVADRCTRRGSRRRSLWRS